MVMRRRSLPLFFTAIVAAGGFGSAACAAVFGFERLSEEGAEAGSAETSTDASEPPVEAGPQCTDLGIPERPTVADAGTDAPGNVHMAIKLLDFGIDKAAAPVGFNLDRTCSPTIAQSSCTSAIDEATFEKYGKDKDERGLDNAGFGLLGYLSYLGSAFAPASINERLTAGEFGAVLRVANWNGTNEDDDVIVEIFPAIGVWQDVDSGAPTPGGKPAFDATDYWMRDRRFQNVVDASRIKSASAWVTGGRLVASFQSVTLPVTVPDDKKPLDVIILEAYATGMLVQDGPSWKLSQGVLGGRWRTADILSQVRTIYVKDTAGLKNAYLCDPGLANTVYNAVKKEVCDGRDLRSTSRDDSKGLPCDAFSAGLKIDTYAVNEPGDFADLTATPPRCQADASVPEADDCAPASP